MSKKPAQQPLLPFILEGNTPPRSTVRTLTKNADGLHKVSIDRIRIRPQFNARRKPEGMDEELWEHQLMIPDLADAIFASNGPAEPILGDFYKEDGCFYITNGERRFRALCHLLRTKRLIYPNNTPIEEVLVLLNPNGTTDLDRKRKVISTQDNMKLKPMERAYYYLSFIEQDGMTHEQLGEFLQVSRQTVDNYILATELPKEIQLQVDTDEIKLSTALSDLREQRKALKPKKATKDDGLPIDEKPKKEEKTPDGDEEDFLQQDNSIKGTSSMGGPRSEGSGAHVVGTDSIYMNNQKTAIWKQMLNRLDVVRNDVASNLPANNAMGEIMTPDEIEVWVEKEIVTRMMNEYNLTVK